MKIKDKILQLKSNGMGVTEIAKELNCSRYKIYYHLDSKLKEKNKGRFSEKFLLECIASKIEENSFSDKGKKILKTIVSEYC